MHMLYHSRPRKVIQALAGHKEPRSMDVYIRVLALDMAATLAVPFTGDRHDAAQILRTPRPDMTTSLTTAYISCSEHITIYGGKTTGSQGSGSNRNAILKSLWIRDMLPVWAALITAYISCSEQNTHQRQ